MNEQESLIRPLTFALNPSDPPSLAAYERMGGYGALRKALSGMTPSAVQKEVTDSGLKGRGGAGFPTGSKWSFVPIGEKALHPKYFIVNADEMEPGTFKDRILMEGNPHQLIEGAVLCSYAIEADVAFIFLRWAYKKSKDALKKSIAEAYEAGYLGKNISQSGYSLQMYLHESSGRYMCGEETGLIDALEGKRATPRSKPPFPQVVGLFGRPTVVNNVETVCNIPHIINNGAAWFNTLGCTEDGGTKLYGVSGNVKKPGLWELPIGATAREVFDRAGWMLDGYSLRGFQPGGASTDFLTTDHLDIPLDFTSVQKAGSRLGTGTIVALDDKTCPVGMVLNLEEFFTRESCGWCTPCRDGIPWAVKTLSALETGNGRERDIEILEHICFMIQPGRTFCAFAPGAAEPLQSAIRLFRGDFERHIREKKCPYTAA